MFLNCMIIQAQELFKLEKTFNGQFNIQPTQYDDEDNFVSKIGRLQYIRIQDENRDAFRNWFL